MWPPLTGEGGPWCVQMPGELEVILQIFVIKFSKCIWQVWSRLWYWESPLGGKMSGRIGHKTGMSPTFDYKLPMKTEIASTWSNIRILQMFSWIYSWSRFRERKTIFYFPRVHRRLITRCASHFNPVLIIKFGFSQFFPLAAHQGLMRYPKMSTWGGLCIDLQGYKSCEQNLENTSKIHRMPRQVPTLQ